MKMKTSEEILLEEVKSEYARQMPSWTDLDHRWNSFLQFSGLLLSIIFIGIGITQNSFDNPISGLLVASSVCIIISIIILAFYSIKRTAIKEINVKVDKDMDIKGKEIDITLSLIRAYNSAQKDVTSKHIVRLKHLSWSVLFLTVGIGFLLSFIITAVLGTFFRV